jgi:catechol 2,3-dioxygenase-like lactoylglutathione lyase family enzyme
MAGVLGTNLVTQIAFVVKDIQTTKAKFAKFLGIPEPEVSDCGTYEASKVEYYGKPAPDANSLLAFLDVGPNLQIELIQPNSAKSVWKDILDEKGEGFHHIAFGIKDTNGKLAALKQIGMECVQRGKYKDGTGEYSYVDGRKDLKTIIELLESY